MDPTAEEAFRDRFLGVAGTERKEAVLKVAGIQMGYAADVEATVARAAALAEVAVDRGARVVAFPEGFAWPWFLRAAGDARAAQAQTIPGPAVERLQEMARRRGVVVVAPVFERTFEGTLFNSAAVLDADGTLMGSQRLVHVPDVRDHVERDYFAPGDRGFSVFKTQHVHLGVLLCWDNFFPEGMRSLALGGAELVICPTANTVAASHPKWERAIVGGAVCNGYYAFRINRTGKEEDLRFYGRSFCVDPNGDPVVEPAGEEESLLIAEVDLERVRWVRRQWPFLRDRRPDAYMP
jgi:N-carbamoylputrescine amidase